MNKVNMEKNVAESGQKIEGSEVYEECKYCNKIINFLHTEEEIKEARIRTLTKKSEEIEEKLREVSKDE